ncbi:hypothetical protein ACFWYW_22535 [Nonomuraea sp. NPDC059023]|uniref:hypothetical protein n=1 Tax=unclassified Nonomuraea TaxID=2593643 RepID=UPI0036BC3998
MRAHPLQRLTRQPRRHHPRTPGATPDTSAQAARDITRHLTEAGYTHPRVETLDLTPPAVCVLAIRP